MLHNVLIVGGNGFIGSAVCKAALARGLQVTSISSSGRPYKTPRGHSPTWTANVKWLAADAFAPESFSHLLPETTAVVHTLGTLLEDTSYKKAMAEGDIGSLSSSFLKSVFGLRVGGPNPLQQTVSANRKTYDAINRDSALCVCKTFISAHKDTTPENSHRRAFVYISAEDIYRPFVPSGYIESKRQAELGIKALIHEQSGLRAAFIRPSLVYHAQFRPLATPIATVLDLSSTLHRHAPRGVPTPAGFLKALGSSNTSSTTESSMGSPLHSVANALTIPPIHVDHVAEAICNVIDDDNVEGVVDVERMRELIGWSLRSQRTQGYGQQGA